MKKQDSEPFNFKQQYVYKHQQQSNKEQNEPFKILYNARSHKTDKSRKSSASFVNESILRIKKPRKMTLPSMQNRNIQQKQQMNFETYSQNNLLISCKFTKNEEQYQYKNPNIYCEQMDLQNVIQFGIATQNDLDRQSWFDVRNQNPQFPLN